MLASQAGEAGSIPVICLPKTGNVAGSTFSVFSILVWYYFLQTSQPALCRRPDHDPPSRFLVESIPTLPVLLRSSMFLGTILRWQDGTGRMAHWQYNMLTQGAVEVLSWPPDYRKGARCYGYILWLVHVCNYALFCYHPCYHDTQQ